MSAIAWTEPALEDLKAVRTWIGRDSKPLADSIVERILDAIEQAIPFPRIGREVAEVENPNVRELLYRTFRIVYKAEADRILVLSVIHGGRANERREPRRWEVY